MRYPLRKLRRIKTAAIKERGSRKKVQRRLHNASLGYLLPRLFIITPSVFFIESAPNCPFGFLRLLLFSLDVSIVHGTFFFLPKRKLRMYIAKGFYGKYTSWILYYLCVLKSTNEIVNFAKNNTVPSYFILTKSNNSKLFNTNDKTFLN